MVRMNVNAGACRFNTMIEAESEDGMNVTVRMESDCPHVKKLAAVLTGVDLMESIATPITDNVIFVRCGEFLAHAACPVPVALVKACEAAGGLALAKDVAMTYER